MGNGHKFNEKNFQTALVEWSQSPNAFTLANTNDGQGTEVREGVKVNHKFHQNFHSHVCACSTLTVPSPMWWTVQGISTIDPTCAVMLVKFAVLNDVSKSASFVPFNWFELLVVVLFKFIPSLNPLLLFIVCLILLKLFGFLLESLIWLMLGTVLLPKDDVTLSRSKIFVWFCSTFFGIIKKPVAEKRKWESKSGESDLKMIDGGFLKWSDERGCVRLTSQGESFEKVPAQFVFFFFF